VWFPEASQKVIPVAAVQSVQVPSLLAYFPVSQVSQEVVAVHEAHPVLQSVHVLSLLN